MTNFLGVRVAATAGMVVAAMLGAQAISAQSGPVAGKRPALVEWGQPRVLTVMLPADAFSWKPVPGNGDAVSALLTGLEVDLASPGDSLSDVRTFSFAVPVRLRAKRAVQFVHDMRLNVYKTANAQATIIVHAGGPPAVLRYPSGMRVPARETRYRIARTVPASTGIHQVTVVVIAERANRQEAVRVGIDTDDISVRRK